MGASAKPRETRDEPAAGQLWLAWGEDLGTLHREVEAGSEELGLELGAYLDATSFWETPRRAAALAAQLPAALQRLKAFRGPMPKATDEVLRCKGATSARYLRQLRRCVLQAGRCESGWRWLDTDKTRLGWSRERADVARFPTASAHSPRGAAMAPDEVDPRRLEGDGVNRQLPLAQPKCPVLSSVWYFTSVDGTIKRKHKTKLDAEYILKEFLKRPLAGGIVAYYVRTAVCAEDAQTGLADSGMAPTTIEYLNEAQLRELLFNRQMERGDGLLQKFLEPPDARNNMIRAQWSPKVCLLERRINRLNLHDTHYDMYERVVTFEGPDFHSEVTPVRGSTLAGKIHQIADTIIQHVAGATNDRVKITRLALNFKVDYKDRLHFLFASSLRLRGSQPLEVNTMLQVPEYIHRAQSVTRASPAVLMRSLVCPTCHQKVHPEMLFDVAYRVIIEYEEQCLAAQRKAKGGDAHLAEEVPPTLRAMHPRLQLSEYLALRKELAFHHKIARVCEGCYLRFSTVQLGAKERLLAPELAEGCGGDASVLFGTGDLDPQRLALRRDATRQKILQRQAMEDAWWDALPAPSAPKRASSCPKLPSWGPDHKGAVLWPPAPVLSRRTALPPESLRPSPPAGPRPRGCELQQVFSTQSPRRRKSQVRGEPYLKAIQDFTAQYRHRAQEVLGPTAELALQGAVDPKRPATEVAESEPEDAAHRSDEETEESLGSARPVALRINESGSQGHGGINTEHHQALDRWLPETNFTAIDAHELQRCTAARACPWVHPC
ncbi:unnamed protein product [Effrenium voratum]|nr:unnamed protein product [Effrenium voratum]